MLSTENSSFWMVFMPGRIGGFSYFKVSVPNTATKLTWKSKNENFRSSHYNTSLYRIPYSEKAIDYTD